MGMPDIGSGYYNSSGRSNERRHLFGRLILNGVTRSCEQEAPETPLQRMCTRQFSNP